MKLHQCPNSGKCFFSVTVKVHFLYENILTVSS